MTDPNKTLLGIIDLKEAKRLKSALEDRGIKLEMFNNPATCTSGGCSCTVELYAPTLDMPKVQEYLKSEHSKNFEGLDFDPELLGEVFDSEKESARCPACGESFSTQLQECPGCGLGFGAT